MARWLQAKPVMSRKNDAKNTQIKNFETQTKSEKNAVNHETRNSLVEKLYESFFLGKHRMTANQLVVFEKKNFENRIFQKVRLQVEKIRKK